MGRFGSAVGRAPVVRTRIKVEPRPLDASIFDSEADDSLPETDFSEMLLTYLHPPRPLSGGFRRADRAPAVDPLMVNERAKPKAGR